MGSIPVAGAREAVYENAFRPLSYFSARNKVELQIGGQTISPSNVFPEEVLLHLQSDEELVIQYGNIKHDELYVWSIKTVQE